MNQAKYTLAPGQVTKTMAAFLNENLNQRQKGELRALMGVGEGENGGFPVPPSDGLNYVQRGGEWVSLTKFVFDENIRLVDSIPAYYQEGSIAFSILVSGGSVASYGFANFTPNQVFFEKTRVGSDVLAESTVINLIVMQTVMDEAAFRSLDMLTTVTCDSDISDSAFYECSNLSNLQLIDGVTRIGVGAFFYCVSLTELLLPSTVSSISDVAFYDCTSLGVLHILTVNPPTLTGADHFGNTLLTEVHIRAPHATNWPSTWAGLTVVADLP